MKLQVKLTKGNNLITNNKFDSGYDLMAKGIRRVINGELQPEHILDDNEIFQLSPNETVLITDKVEKTEIHDNIIMYPKSKGIAQFVVLPVPKVEIEEVDFETIMSYKSNRMEGKIGSSGK